MATVREAILEGVKEAQRFHDEIDVRHTVESAGGRIDVFGALLRYNVLLIFRPLDGLLGAYLSQPVRGVIVSTQRPLSIQRYTGAHELGHVVLGHEASLDSDEILTRMDHTPRSLSRHVFDEIMADAFASEFLVPKWLLQEHARRQGWNRDSMQEPIAVYQMSLRIGASYEATCRALRKFNIVDEVVLHTLINTPPRSIKQQLLGGFQPDNWYPDVWVLTERDEGAILEGGPNDLFILKLHEKSGAGYLWNVDQLRNVGFAIIRDERLLPSEEDDVGGPVTRSVTVQSDNTGRGQFILEHRRPWQAAAEPLERLAIGYDLFGREEGMPRAQRLESRAA